MIHRCFLVQGATVPVEKSALDRRPVEIDAMGSGASNGTRRPVQMPPRPGQMMVPASAVGASGPQRGQLGIDQQTSRSCWGNWLGFIGETQGFIGAIHGFIGETGWDIPRRTRCFRRTGPRYVFPILRDAVFVRLLGYAGL